MIKGIYSTEATMRPKMARLEVLANNMANTNSTGFKRDRIFVQMIKESSDGYSDGRGGLDGVGIDHYVDMQDGGLQQTDNPMSLAIQGRGFFVIDTPQGTRYTRNGNFTLSGEGALVTTEGNAVMGNEGKIRFPNFDRFAPDMIKITLNGEISLGDQHIARLRIVDIENPEQLKKDHQSLFMTHESQKVHEIPDDKIAVRQGYLEESNVNGIEEMVAMIELSRSFETDQRAIKALDASLDRSMEIGRV